MSNRCHSSSTAAAAGDAGPVLKGFYRGTHRLVDPLETIARIQPHLAAMGITRVANVTGLDHIGMPVVTVVRPNARSLSVSQGKGLDLAAAQASGLMECIELYHAEHIALPLRLGSYQELKDALPLADVDLLPRRPNLLFHHHLPILWIEGFDLVSQTARWVPHSTVHMNFTAGQPADADCFIMNSNGLASGNVLLEASIHGLCEVIERDATTLYYLRQQMDGESVAEAARVDPSTIDDPLCCELLRKFEAADVTVSVADITSDIGVPAFECVIIERNCTGPRTLHPSGGFGCHPAREVALLRALTEAAQSRLTYISGARDDATWDLYEAFSDRQFLTQHAASIANQRPSRSFHDAPTWIGTTFEDDLRFLLKSLRQAGLHEVITVDLTKPQFRIPVVRVLVPGLETMGPGTDHFGTYTPGARALAVLAKGRNHNR